MNKRAQAREAAEALASENRYLGDKTLGAICSAGVVSLAVSCQNCPRSGRYRVTRLIDRYGANMRLVDLKPLLAGDCRFRLAASPHDRCAVRFPGLSRHEVRWSL